MKSINYEDETQVRLPKGYHRSNILSGVNTRGFRVLIRYPASPAPVQG
jgi:hypothetical protein